MRKTFRLSALLAAAILFGSALGSVATAQDYDPKTVPPVLPNLEGRVISSVSSEDYVPFSFVDANSNRAVGFEFELLSEICYRINCQLEHKTAAWDGMIAAVSRSEYDLGHVGITVTDERKEQVDFSDPFVVVEQKLMVRADEARFATAAEFLADAALKFGAQPGTTSYFSASFLVGEEATADRVVAYDAFAIAVEAVVRGDVDAVVTDAVSGAGFVGANAGQLKLLDEVINTDPLAFIFPKGSDLVVPFNLALESMRTDGFLAYLENKWFFIYQPPASE
jgi:polar amino acid transport system substrate-binding protein